LFIFQLVPIQKGEWVMMVSSIGCTSLALLLRVTPGKVCYPGVQVKNRRGQMAPCGFGP
jgi:hypothetical protein